MGLYIVACRANYVYSVLMLLLVPSPVVLSLSIFTSKAFCRFSQPACVQVDFVEDIKE